MKIFIDSDVVISSLLSTNGASYQLLQKDHCDRYISSFSYKELMLVIQRLSIPLEKLDAVIKQSLHMVDISSDIQIVRKEYNEYVVDIHDAHIVAGAHISKARFLITYNTKHFRVDKIKQKCNCIVLTPGQFL